MSGLFNLNEDVRRSVSSRPSIISEDLVIDGRVVSSGTVVLKGSLFGDVEANCVTIDRDGTLTGTLTAEAAIVGGTIEGDVFCTRLSLSATALVEGDVSYTTITVEDGARLNGLLSHRAPVAG